MKLKEKQQVICHLENFAAIDFETANNVHSSICSVGVVVVRSGVITDKFYSLIQPEPNYYCYWNTKIHGIKLDDTEDAPVFPKVWNKIETLIEGLPLVAHNKVFDEDCLKTTFKVYQMDYPDYQFYCTYRASEKVFPDLINHKLDTVASHCGFDMTNHHNALADAEACAIIAINIFK